MRTRQALFSAPGVAERAQAALPVAVQELPEVNGRSRPHCSRSSRCRCSFSTGGPRIEFKAAARNLSEWLADARLAEIAGAGHIGPLTTAEPVANELVAFFSS